MEKNRKKNRGKNCAVQSQKTGKRSKSTSFKSSIHEEKKHKPSGHSLTEAALSRSFPMHYCSILHHGDDSEIDDLEILENGYPLQTFNDLFGPELAKKVGAKKEVERIMMNIK